MRSIAPSAPPADLQGAREGDRVAFEDLVRPHLERLRALTTRMLGDPDDAADASQETLLRAFREIRAFRGDASFATWLLHIATNVCLDVLRRRGRWRVEAQPMAKDECVSARSSLHRELADTVSDPSFVFEAREHIAFCFTCVSRTLQAEAEVAIVLGEVLGLANREAAEVMGLTEPAFRRRLAAGRAQMQSAFDGLCALVSKTGTCYQCSELRDYTAEERRGPQIPSLGAVSDPLDDRWRRRLEVVRSADLEGGRSRTLHDLLFRWISANGRASVDPSMT